MEINIQNWKQLPWIATENIYINRTDHHSQTQHNRQTSLE